MVTETEALLRIGIAVVLGAILGIEREIMDKPAGLRTHILVAEGSALFMVGSILLTQDFGGANSVENTVRVDPSRIASTIVTGVGFLGGGMILQSKDRVYGLTTAAGIWVASAIGLLVGAGYYWVSIVGTLAGVGTLVLLRIPERWIGSGNTSSYLGASSSSSPDEGQPPDRE